MKLIPIESLSIPANRQRKEFTRASLDDLAASILSKGLMHPPVVQNDGTTLVAGERRCRVISELAISGKSFLCNGQLIPPGSIPVTLLGDLSPLALREAELEENTHRVDLTWQERAAAIADLHQLRTEIAADSGLSHSITATASEIVGAPAKGSDITSTHEAILLSEHLSIPAVREAKTQKEAIKALRRIKETEHRARLSATVDLSSLPEDLRLGSMIELMPTLLPTSFDCILTDPPYGVDADSFGSMSTTGHNYVDSWENAKELYLTLAREGYRVAKPEAHLYAFCDITRFSELSLIFSLEGWEVWPKPIIWDKGNGMLPRPEHGPRYTYETILFASKGSRRTLCVKPDIIRISAESKLLHGAQKPVALYLDLLSRTCLPGNSVLDPFGGSGTIIPAARSANLACTMFEIISENFDIAVERANTVEETIDTLNFSI